MKNIKIIEMGGTISAEGLHRLDLKDYTSGIYSSNHFMQTLPELNEFANVSFEIFSTISSTKICTEHWIQLRKLVCDLAESVDCDGIVISHGTSTLEETAFFLHLTVPTDKPIVFVGAQRPYSALSSDAQLNFIQAVQVAACDEAHGKGVLIVLNNTISSARDASKTSTYRLETFQSGVHGFLGVIDADHTVQFYRQPTRKHTLQSEFSALTISNLPAVEIIYSYAGADGFLIEQITNSGLFSGIVVAGTGAGLLTPEQLEATEKAMEKDLFVVRSSRVGNGRVMPIQSYESYPFIHADDLLPQKARILLMVSLCIYNDISAIQHIFNTY